MSSSERLSIYQIANDQQEENSNHDSIEDIQSKNQARSAVPSVGAQPIDSTTPSEKSLRELQALIQEIGRGSGQEE
jgi:hypothetical protein